MDAKLGLERLFRWAFARPAPRTVDAAEVGTAFGMELSIDAARQSDAARKADTPDPSSVPQPGLRRRKRD
jgi:hypothetical protein